MYSVDVIGRTWEGFKSTYTYTGDAIIKNRQDVKALAGDFCDVEDYRITQTRTVDKTIPNGIRTITDIVVLRDWEMPESDVIWADANEDYEIREQA